jgi:ATP-dependent helicase/DNAse subunit B
MKPVRIATEADMERRSSHRDFMSDVLLVQPQHNALRRTQKFQFTAANPLILSVSELTSWLRCRLQHHWRHNIGLSMNTTPERLALGTLGHKVMEEFYTLAPAKRTVPAMKKLVKTLVRDTTEKALDANARKLLEAMLIGFAAWRTDDAQCEHTDARMGLEACWPELPFYETITPDGSIVVRGKIDGVFVSTAHKATVGMMETKFNKDIRFDDVDNRLQLSTYLWALRRLFPKAKRYVCYYQILRKQMPSPRVRTPLFHREPVERTHAEIQLFEQDILQQALDLPHGAIYPHYMDSCNWMCDFRMACQQRSEPDDVQYILSTEYTTRAQRDKQKRKAEKRKKTA